LKRNLLALILVGKDRSWHADYSGLIDNVQTLAGAVRVVSDHIPTRKQPYHLLENFLDITDLALEIEALVNLIRVKISLLIHSLCMQVALL